MWREVRELVLEATTSLTSWNITQANVKETGKAMGLVMGPGGGKGVGLPFNSLCKVCPGQEHEAGTSKCTWEIMVEVSLMFSTANGPGLLSLLP